MMLDGHFLTNTRKFIMIYIDADDGGRLIGATVGEDVAPGVDGEGVAEGGSFFVVLSNLSRGENISLSLDGPSSEEEMPMGLTGRNGKCGWNEDDVGAALR